MSELIWSIIYFRKRATKCKDEYDNITLLFGILKF